MKRLDDQNEQLEFAFMEPNYKTRVLAAISGYMKKPGRRAHASRRTGRIEMHRTGQEFEQPQGRTGRKAVDTIWYCARRVL